MRPNPRPISTSTPAAATDRAPLFFAAALIALAAFLAYSNSFSGPFVQDDFFAVTTNPSVRHLWPIGDALSPPAALTVGGRPLLNLTFAVNYALSGEDPWSYHVFNLLVHILAGLALLGVARRTLLQPALAPRFGKDALPLAAAIAVLWTLHPVQTEAVTYISQRSESLMGLCYLLTLYGFIRATTPAPDPRPWFSASVVACFAGLAFKEVIITAPVVIFLYDRTFVAGTFGEAWRLRRRYYTALAANWLAFAWFLRGIGQRAVGLDRGVNAWNYALTECRAIVQYLTLIVWPHPLVFDYGNTLASGPLEVLPQALAVLALLAVTVLALVRWPLFGFAGAWFFLILAPTSSFIPILKSPIADHRLYLPLAAAIVVGVLGLYAVVGRKSLWAFGVAALVWGALTFARNEDYRSAIGLWEITVAQAPDNARARVNLGGSYLQAGRWIDAVAPLQAALQIEPQNAEAHNNLGLALTNLQQPAAAFPNFAEALRIDPTYTAAQNNWGNALLQINHLNEAIDHFQAALQIDPGFTDARNGLAVALARSGRPEEAIRELQEVLRRDPGSATARENLERIEAGER